jgi:hypothetical protein
LTSRPTLKDRKRVFTARTDSNKDCEKIERNTGTHWEEIELFSLVEMLPIRPEKWENGTKLGRTLET